MSKEAIQKLESERKIIGITGTIGAGKDTLAEYLQKKGFIFMSVRDFLLEEIEKRKIDYSEENIRDVMVEVANDLREKNGSSYIAEQLYLKASQENNNSKFAFGSLRTPGEIMSLKEKGGCLIVAVNAFWFLRYLRVIKRKGVTDKISPIKFLSQEVREMKNNDPNKQNLRKCIQMADIVINNNGSVKSFYKKIDKVLK